ncbi:MAG TPA: type II toxin-antitoxin system PemK/MazF family toxin [Pyrinomonadaceae bacterium]|nr:type II toxin-antitoxin system PemK/MazF family toxin [Pyrinomonadaceae bacterium]
MTSYNFGDVVLVPFPFTDQTGNKKRPAVVVSSAIYNSARLDLILMAITSRVKTSRAVGEVEVTEWQKAGLLKASVIKPILTTIEKRLVVRHLGQLEGSDCLALRQALNTILG